MATQKLLEYKKTNMLNTQKKRSYLEEYYKITQFKPNMKLQMTTNKGLVIAKAKNNISRNRRLA